MSRAQRARAVPKKSPHSAYDEAEEHHISAIGYRLGGSVEHWVYALAVFQACASCRREKLNATPIDAGRRISAIWTRPDGKAERRLRNSGIAYLVDSKAPLLCCMNRLCVGCASLKDVEGKKLNVPTDPPCSIESLVVYGDCSTFAAYWSRQS